MSDGFLISGPGISAGAILGIAARALRRRKDRRELKQAVQRWEYEGGNVLGRATASTRPK